MTEPTENKNALRDLILNALSSHVSIQSVKTNFGHDMAGHMCTVVFKKKKAFSHHDDGCRGGGEYATIKQLDAAAYQAFISFVKEKNIAQIMFDNGWSFMENVESISLETVISYIVETFVYKHVIDANLKKIMAKTPKAFVISDATNKSYIEFFFKGRPLLSDVRKHPKGLEYLTNRYNEALANAKEKNMSVINTPEQLKLLGLIT